MFMLSPWVWNAHTMEYSSNEDEQFTASYNGTDEAV